MNNNDNTQCRYEDYIGALSIYNENNNPVRTDESLQITMETVLNLCKCIDRYLTLKTSSYPENYYNRQDVINYQDGLNKYSLRFVDNKH